MLTKKDMSFANRFMVAPYMACKSCDHCKNNPRLDYLVGNIPDEKGKFIYMDMDQKIQEVLHERTFCVDFETENDIVIERDTTYQGTTHAPHDSSDPTLMKDSSDIDHDYNKPLRCINQYTTPPVHIIKNEWDKCLKLLFDRKRIIPFPSNTKVLELLNNSFMPQYVFRLGLPPMKGMGFDRGLWFYRSEPFNSTLDKNKDMKREMKKIIMVYLYNVWFKHLPEELKEGFFIALESSNNYSLAKDLSWWMVTVFKDETALTLHPVEPECELEFISLSLMDRAMEAEMVNQSGLTSFELDIECVEYDKLVSKLGYGVEYESLADKDGHEIY